MKLYSLFYKGFLILICVWLMSSCDMLSGLGIGSSAQYSLIPTEGLSTEHIPAEDFFYVNISAGYYYGKEFNPLDAIIYAMDDGPGTDCKISVNEDSTEDLYCVLDIMEGDLFFHTLVLEYNVPPGMCDYSGFIVPYHLNQKIANGPEEVSSCGVIGEEDKVYCPQRESPRQPDRKVGDGCKHKVPGELRQCTYYKKGCKIETDICANAEGVQVQGNTGCGTQADCEDPDNACGGTDNNGNDLSGIWHDTAENGCANSSYDDIEKICESHGFNKSNVDLANCCFGDYTLHTGESRTTGKWGGDFNECIGGPVRFDSWQTLAGKDAYSKRVIENTQKEGLKVPQFELDALINIYDDQKTIGRATSFITANHWEDVEDKDFNSSKSKLKIYSVQDLTQEDINNGFTLDNLPGGQPFFVWSCLDKAKEIKHRIILLIREWNTQKEYNKFKETSGSSGDPDIVGAEGDLCDYYTTDEKDLFRYDSDCNDYLDLDDWINESDPSDPYPEVIYKESSD